MEKEIVSKFEYYPLKLWTDSLLFLTIFITLIVLTAFSRYQPIGAILGVVIFLLVRRHFFKTLRNLSRQLQNQPAIELTNHFFYDHIDNIKIRWDHISHIDISFSKSSTFVVLNLRNDSQYKRRMDFINRFLSSLLGSDGTYAQTELSVIKGKNKTIFNEIHKFHSQANL